ncbi:phosphotransferase [bacterium]|nr:phosphotransferase [bacterium]
MYNAEISPILYTSWPNAKILWIDKFDTGFLQDIGRKIMQAGTLCVFIRTKDERFLREALAETSFSEFSCYALVPSHHAPRWLIPLDNRRVTSASLRLYNPSSLKGKVFKHILSNLAYLGIQRFWGRDRLLVASKVDAQDASLATFLQYLLNVRDISLAFSTGTLGYYRKTTAQVMSKDGRVLAYAKIASTPQAQRLLAQEAKVLRSLAELRLSTGNVPRLLYSGQFHGSELLVQSAPSERTRKGKKQLDRRHIEFLAEIFNQTCTRKSFSESEYWILVRRSVESLRARISDEWRRRLQNGLKICESALARKVIPLGLCHRDFVPWNTYLERWRLYVFDWEYAVEQGIPFWDIFHYFSFPAMLVARSSGKQLINRWWGRQFKPLLTQYAEKIGVDVGLVPAYFLLYLIEVSSFYLDMFACDGIQETQREWLQKTWAEMLDELTMHWEEYKTWR